MVHRLYDDRYGMPDEFDIMSCPTCDAFYLPEYPTEASMPLLYETYYGSTTGAGRGRSNKFKLFVRSTKFWSYLIGGVDLAAYVHAGEDVLDVGCGYGTNIEPVRHRGATWSGLDVDPKVCSALKARGEDVYCGSVREFSKSTKARFDVVLMSQVIEHTSDPICALRSAAGLLTPNGRIVISCPNAASRYLTEYGRRWLHWHVPYHTLQFTQRTLSMAAGRAGLNVVWWRALTPPSWYLAQKRIRAPKRGSRNASFNIRAEAFTWLLHLPALRFMDASKKGSGDALVAVFEKKEP